MRRCFLALLLFAAFSPICSFALQFSLRDASSGMSFGPYTLYNGARIRLSGALYEVVLPGDGRISFSEIGGKAAYGPYQTVDGRFMRIGGRSYLFSGVGDSAPQAPLPAKSGPLASFAPVPPRPERIRVPDEPASKGIAPLDLPALPSAKRDPYWSARLTAENERKMKWKADSLLGTKSPIRRRSIAALAGINSWHFGVEKTSGVESGNILPPGLGVLSSSMSGGSGYSLEGGYKRPFLVEGGWKASLGVRAKFRKEEGDLKSVALLDTGSGDTNNLDNVLSEYAESVSRIKLSEKRVMVDLELAYVRNPLTGFVSVTLEPYCDVSVSGSLYDGKRQAKISAEPEGAIGVKFGVEYALGGGWRIGADFSPMPEKALNFVLSRNF